MEGKKTKEGLNVRSRLLQERGRNKRPTQVLSWPRDFRQDFRDQHPRRRTGQAAAPMVDGDVTLWDLERFPDPGMPPKLGWTKPAHLQKNL